MRAYRNLNGRIAGFWEEAQAKLPLALGVFSAAATLSAAASLGASDAVSVPSDSQNAARALERFAARLESRQELPVRFHWTVRKVVEELDKEGQIHDRDVFVYRVLPVLGQPYRRLLTKNGRPLDSDELREEEKAEEKFRERIEKGDRHPRMGDRDLRIDRQLLERFEFSFEKTEEMDGRAAFLFRFHPKSGLETKGTMERALQQFEGSLWLDAEEFELARLKIRLNAPLNIGWGLIGRIDRFELDARRLRLADGAWVSGGSNGVASFRSLLDRKRVRWREEVGAFARIQAQRIPPPAQSDSAPTSISNP